MKNDGLVLLMIAFDDISSSEILYQNKLFPQSLFYLQQATEKSIKQIGIISGFVNEQDLYSKIGHRTDKIFKGIIKGISHLLDGSVDNFDKDYDKLKFFLKQQDKEKLIKSIKKLLGDWRTKEIGLEQLDKILRLSLKEKAPSYLDKLETDKKAKEEYEEYMKEVNLYFPDYARATMILLFINMIISDLVSTVRYPDPKNFENPSDIYNLDNPVVELAPFLIENVKFSIKALSNFKLMLL